ncbi:MAG: protein kinase [Candidatus Eisenbacteria bacterium]|uniref:Protein kinase n=1 Tax=Eiseniibacteriota bacterium TaxID=2212470 RepID=A0A956RRS6_UNCEI|nr:protein kinase [Candidatus Eisenbacteria bacterium]
MALGKGSHVGKYQLISRLGRGAFAEVWKALDQVENRKVALKIASTAAVSEFGRTALEHEARMASSLQHPNILKLYNAGWDKDRFFLAFELASKSLLDASGVRRSTRVSNRAIRQIAEALAYAHRKRVIHRDVKPENILVFDHTRFAIGDFGASCLSRNPGQTYSEIGTLGYLAPEQAYGKPCFASDVFSLGMIWYWLLAGNHLRWPFDWPEDEAKKIKRRLHPAYVPILRRMLRFRPEDRFRTAGDLVEAIERARRRIERESQEKAQPRRRRRKRRVISPREAEVMLFGRLFGKSLGLGFICHRCDGPLSEEMTYCPWCGTGDLSFLDVTRYPLVCPWCEHGVMAEWEYCPWCYAGRFESNGKKPRFDSKAERICPTAGCEGQLRPFMKYCPQCKTKVKRRWSTAALPHGCARCRWPINRDYWRYCPWCGRREPKAGHFV